MLTGNRSWGKVDVVLLSAKDGSVISNLTKGYTGRYEDIKLNFTARFIGRSIAFDPRGDTVAFFGRTGKGRSLLLTSVLTGRHRQAGAPARSRRDPVSLPSSRRPARPVLRAQGGRLGHLPPGPGDAGIQEPHPGRFYDSDPQVSPDGTLVVYTRRISGHEKVTVLPAQRSLPEDAAHLRQPGRRHADLLERRDQALLLLQRGQRDHERAQPRSAHGRGRASTRTCWAANMSPVPLKGKAGDRLVFISYFKGEFHLASKDLTEPLKELDQDVQVASEDIVDFQPDVVHQVVPENKRRKHLFEGLYLEGRPPLNVGVTSSGDFFGGSQVALTDVLGDQNFTMTALSIREFRTYLGNYLNLAGRFQYGFSGFDTTRSSSPRPSSSSSASPGRAPSPRSATRAPPSSANTRWTSSGASRSRRASSVYASGSRTRRWSSSCASRRRSRGVRFILNNGTYVPLGVNLVQETTHFAGFGPLSGSTFSLGFQTSLAGSLTRHTVDVDARKYFRLGSTSLVFADARPRLQVLRRQSRHLLLRREHGATGLPLPLLRRQRGLLREPRAASPARQPAWPRPSVCSGRCAGRSSGAWAAPASEACRTSSRPRDPGVSFVNDPVFGEPVSGFHLVDGRASFGFGLQFFILGYPLHFDWSKLTDLKVVVESHPVRLLGRVRLLRAPSGLRARTPLGRG